MLQIKRRGISTRQFHVRTSRHPLRSPGRQNHPRGAIFARDEDDDDDERAKPGCRGSIARRAHNRSAHGQRRSTMAHEGGRNRCTHPPRCQTFRRLTARKSHAVIESARTLFRASKYSFPDRASQRRNSLETSWVSKTNCLQNRLLETTRCVKKCKTNEKTNTCTEEE